MSYAPIAQSMVISGLEKQLVQERICVIMRRRRFVAGALIGALRTCHLLCEMCPPIGAVRQMGLNKGLDLKSEFLHSKPHAMCQRVS